MQSRKIGEELNTFLMINFYNTSTKSITYFREDELFNFAIIAVNKREICGNAIALNSQKQQSSIKLATIFSNNRESKEKIGTNLLYLFYRTAMLRDFKNFELTAVPESLKFYEKTGLPKGKKINALGSQLITGEIRPSLLSVEKKLTNCYDMALPELSFFSK
jgi:hypothetical protein